jgi:hypothetical protein
VAVVGEVVEGIAVPAGIEVVSLVERFGDERARADAPGCIAAAMAEVLSQRP